MTAREHAAFAAGMRHAADLALVAALTVELRQDAAHVRQQAAIASLRGLAEALKTQAPKTAISCSQPDLNRRADPSPDLSQPSSLP